MFIKEPPNNHPITIHSPVFFCAPALPGQVFVRSGWLCLVMDFADGGDLCAAVKAWERHGSRTGHRWRRCGGGMVKGCFVNYGYLMASLMVNWLWMDGCLMVILWYFMVSEQLVNGYYCLTIKNMFKSWLVMNGESWFDGVLNCMFNGWLMGSQWLMMVNLVHVG